MLRKLITLCLQRRPLVLTAFVAFLGLGFAAFTTLNIEAYPDPAPPIIEIITQWPGQSPEEVERYITIPVEIAIASTPGLKFIRSNTVYALSFIRLQFEYGNDYYFVRQQTINRLTGIALPNGVQPTISPAGTISEIFRYQLKGPPGMDLIELKTLQDWVVERKLRIVPGVSDVLVLGGKTKEFQAEIDLNRMMAYGLTLPQVLTAISASNANVGGRTLNIGEQSVNVRGLGNVRTLEDIGNIVLTQQNGVPVLLSDVAKVQIGFVPRLGVAGRDDTTDIIFGVVLMQKFERTMDMVTRVRAAIQRINTDGSLPPGVVIEPFYDRGDLVAITVQTVLHNMLFGVALIFLIQWVFLGNLRCAIIVSATIPVALFLAVIITVLRGESANLLSVGAIDLGIIVDSTVIMLENIFRHLAHPLVREPADDGSGLSERLRRVLAGAVEVDKPIFFSVIITIAAFLPLFTMQGVEGQIFSPMARTYGYALVGALIATFTITPALASLLLPEHVSEVETTVVRILRSIYTPVLRWSLVNRKSTVAIGLVFLAVTGFIGSRLGSEFLPALEEGNLWIRAAMPPTISLEAGMPVVNRIREVLMRHPEAITVVSQHGRPDNGSDAAGFFNAEFFVPLKPFEEWARGMTKEKLIDELQKEFAAEFTGVGFNFSQYIQDNVEEGISGVKGANSLKIVGPNLEILEQIANRALAEMAQVRGVRDLGIFRVLGQPNLNIRVDRERAARYGLNVSDVNTVVQAALGGTVATTLLEADRQFNVTVRLAPEYRNSLAAVSNIKVGYQTPNGNAYIPLSELASITLDTGASYIFRERNQRFIPIKFSVRGRDLAGTVAEAQERIANNVKLPTGYRIEWAGEFEGLQQAKKRLTVIIPISFILIMVLLYGLFNSFRDSLMALVGIPFAVCGGILGLYVAGLEFSISAAIGFVSLFGVSVMSGILIINGYNRVAAGADDPLDAMFQAVEQQMRPILMMALSACIGLLPAAISTGIGSQVQRPLATVVVGGMLIGPIMFLVVVPALQSFFLRPGGSPRPRPAEAEQVVPYT
jgi:heavy metal efflux system protein